MEVTLVLWLVRERFWERLAISQTARRRFESGRGYYLNPLCLGFQAIDVTNIQLIDIGYKKANTGRIQGHNPLSLYNLIYVQSEKGT